MPFHQAFRGGEDGFQGMYSLYLGAWKASMGSTIVSQAGPLIKDGKGQLMQQS